MKKVIYLFTFTMFLGVNVFAIDTNVYYQKTIDSVLYFNKNTGINNLDKNNLDDFVLIKKEEALKKEDKNLSIVDDTFKKLIKNNNKKNYIEGDVIIKFKKNYNYDSNLKAFSEKNNLNIKYNIKNSNISIFNTKDKTTESLIKEFKDNPDIEYIEPNYILKAYSTTPNDSYFSNLWGLNNASNRDINAPEAWDVYKGNNVVVAVLDSGVAYNHPDLKNNLWDGLNCKDENGNFLGGCNYGYDFVNNDKYPLDDNGHGSHVAGIIGASGNNSRGVTGVNWNIKIAALKILDSNGSADVITINRAIDFAIQNNIKIINASIGGPNYSLAQQDAITRFRDFGGIFIAAAGNESSNNDSTASYPCNYNIDNIICVAATDQNDNLSSFSNYGATNVDIAAPGSSIYSTVPNSIVVNENFNTLTAPNIPSNWIKTGTFGTYDFSGNKVLYGDLNYPYLNNNVSLISSYTYNLSNSISAKLSFFAKCDTELYSPFAGYGDYMKLLFSSDGGSNYTEIIRFNEKNLADSGLNSSILPVDIPSNYLNSNFKFMFVWVTDSGNLPDIPYDGCFVDDLRIEKFTDGSDEKYEYKDGTSMATPYVTGLAALLVGHNPNLSYQEIKNIILGSGNSLASLTGKTSTGKKINLYNALISDSDLTLLKSETQDLNNNGKIDALKLTFSKNIKDSTLNLNDFTISGVYNDSKVFSSTTNGDTSDNNIVYISFTETGIYDGDIKPVVSYAKGSLMDYNSYVYLKNTSITSEDKIVPRILSSETIDLDGDSKIDNLKLTFSENVKDNLINLNNIVLTSPYNSGKSFVSTTNADIADNNIVYITVPENLVIDTGVRPDINFLANSIFDLSNNYLQAINISPDDKIPPIITSISTKDLNSNNRLDAIKIYFSENIKDSSVDVANFALASPYNSGKSFIATTNSDIANNNFIYITFDENSVDDLSANILVDYVKGSLVDSSDNFLSNISKTALKTYAVSGNVKYYDGAKNVSNAVVYLEDASGNQVSSVVTDSSGNYIVNDAFDGSKIRILKSDNSSSGVSSSDLIKMRRHIVGLEVFDSIYKKIAGDLNASLNVSSADLIKTRRLIVGLEYPINTWRFYKKENSLNESNYLTTDIYMDYVGLNSDLVNQDFIGIKIGDVNNSWSN